MSDTWTLDQMAAGEKPEIPAKLATAQQYEDAIRHCERVFAKNKSRMWVLKILREQIARAS